MRLSPEQIDRLRHDFPEAYEERTELVDLSARLWNCLAWYGSDMKKFRGRLAGLAITLRDRHTAEHGDQNGNPMISTVNAMSRQRDYWINCETR